MSKKKTKKKGSAKSHSTAKGKREGNRRWTVLVYLAGDNNLTAEMVWALQELKKTSAARKLNRKGIDIVAHFDPGGLRSRRYDITRPNEGNGRPADRTQDGNLDATVVYTQRYLEAAIRKQQETRAPRASMLAKLGEPGQALSAFIMSQVAQLQEAGQYHDGRHFLVVLSGHGSGAEGDFLIDTDPRTSLTIPELGIILNEARRMHYEQRPEKGAKPEKGPGRIAILGLDSCLMSNIEVCYEIRESVNYLIASEGFVENTGWPYHRVVEALLANAGADSRVISREIAKRYRNFYRDYEISGVSTDIAACNLSTFRNSDGLVTDLGKLAKGLIPRLEAYHARQLVEFAKKEAVDRAEQKLLALADGIATTLGTPHLRNSLMNGSGQAQSILQKGTLPVGNPKRESVSARIALLELTQSLDGEYRRRGGSASEIPVVKKWKFPADVTAPVALALVRAQRELDPGVEESLAIIEQLDSQGIKEAKQAREMLLAFHYLRQILELVDYGVRPGELAADKPLVDALVAARWEAQSFKGGVYVDLYDFCERFQAKFIGEELNGLKKTIRSVRSSLNRAVAESFTTGADFQHAHGLSAYFPVMAVDYTPKYMNLQFAKETGWGRLVRAYLEATRRPRRQEETEWSGGKPIQRYTNFEVDPLHRDDIEARIIGVVESATADSAATTKPGRGGNSNSAKGGNSNSAKGGNSNSAKGGNSNSAKGKLVTVFGNEADGFRRIRP